MPVGSETLKFGIKQVDKNQVLALKLSFRALFLGQGEWRRAVPPPKWSPPSKWSPPPKWPPITTEMIPTTELIPVVTTEIIPGIISGMELRGLQKLDNNLVCVFYLFILHFGGLTLDYSCSKDAIHLFLLFLRIFFSFFHFGKKRQGCVRYYGDDQTVCDLCQYMETLPDVMQWGDLYIWISF